ncbi:HD-GYP domain-containing protein [Shewanella sp. GXUN23E]|uniref:HD-GYP domain-containing protein n=1 Tax=Shewanella sp. GXUN23E TaxID=3422498 RepID=UPI003D7D527E
MTASTASSQLIKVPVSRLALGMYVTDVDQSKVLTVVTAGLLRRREAISRLKRSNIKFVWVDANKSLPGSGLNNQAGSRSLHRVAQQGLKAPNSTRRQTLLCRQKKARHLVTEAKGMIRKVLGEVFEGKAIEVAPVEVLADKIIESVMLDTDALQYVSALRSKDAYLLEHSVNVAVLLVTFGRHLDLPATTLRQLAVGGILHDIGKIRIDNRILHKPGRLTPQEYEQIKQHQAFAMDALANSTQLHPVSKEVCLMHHEKLDGSGYPCGLAGDAIPLHGRISNICDIYDALTADRCYKEAMSPAAAFKVLLGMTPDQLDQQLVYEFIRCVGVYPVGSLVQLTDGRVGIVWDACGREVRQPVVKCFYSLKQQHYTEVSFVDLQRSPLEIERGISAGSLTFDPSAFF